jgi:hypothetical protein
MQPAQILHWRSLAWVVIGGPIVITEKIFS